MVAVRRPVPVVVPDEHDRIEEAADLLDHLHQPLDVRLRRIALIRRRLDAVDRQRRRAARRVPPNGSLYEPSTAPPSASTCERQRRGRADRRRRTPARREPDRFRRCLLPARGLLLRPSIAGGLRSASPSVGDRGGPSGPPIRTSIHWLRHAGRPGAPSGSCRSPPTSRRPRSAPGGACRPATRGSVAPGARRSRAARGRARAMTTPSTFGGMRARLGARPIRVGEDVQVGQRQLLEQSRDSPNARRSPRESRRSCRSRSTRAASRAGCVDEAAVVRRRYTDAASRAASRPSRAAAAGGSAAPAAATRPTRSTISARAVHRLERADAKQHVVVATSRARERASSATIRRPRSRPYEPRWTPVIAISL